MLKKLDFSISRQLFYLLTVKLGGYSEGKTGAGVFSFHYLHGGASTVYSSRGVLTRFSWI